MISLEFMSYVVCFDNFLYVWRKEKPLRHTLRFAIKR